MEAHGVADAGCIEKAHLVEALLESFARPRPAASLSLRSVAQPTQCAICMSAFKEGDLLRQLSCSELCALPRPPAVPPSLAPPAAPPCLAPVPCSPASLLPCPLALLTRRGRLGSTPWHAAGRTLALSRSLPPSRHVFCNGCIQQWLDKNTSCPMCRTECGPPASPAPPEPSPTLLGRELGPSLFGLGSMLGGAMGGGPGGAQPIGMMASIGAPACSKVSSPLPPGRCPKCVPPPQRPPLCPPLPSPPPGRVY